MRLFDHMGFHLFFFRRLTVPENVPLMLFPYLTTYVGFLLPDRDYWHALIVVLLIYDKCLVVFLFLIFLKIRSYEGLHFFKIRSHECCCIAKRRKFCKLLTLAKEQRRKIISIKHLNLLLQSQLGNGRKAPHRQRCHLPFRSWNKKPFQLLDLLNNVNQTPPSTYAALQIQVCTENVSAR